MMFNNKTQSIYYKYLQLFEDFANEYADELPERTKVKFQKSLVQYYDAELAEAIKHEKFVLKAKNALFRRALKAQRKIARFPSITEQEVNKKLQALGLQENVTTEIIRLMVTGLSLQDEPIDEQPPEVPFAVGVQQDEQQDDITPETLVDSATEPPVDGATATLPVLDDEPQDDVSGEEPQDDAATDEPKGSYWTNRRKNRQKATPPIT